MSVDEPWVSSEEKQKQDLQKRRNIPDDVIDAAKSAFKSIPRVSYALWGKPQLGTAYVENHAVEAAARAILAEREANQKRISQLEAELSQETERCARIAEEFGDNGPNGEDEGHWTRGDEIALRIRG